MSPPHGRPKEGSLLKNPTRRQIVLAMMFVCLQACATLPEQVVRVEEKDSGRLIELKPGQILEIQMATFPGRGLTISLGSVVTPTLAPHGEPKHHDDTAAAGFTGIGSYEAWRFRAVQPGEVNVRMDYRLQWEATGEPTRSVVYKVAVE